MALKRVKIEHEKDHGYPLSSIREINILLALRHPNIVTVWEVVVGATMDQVFIVLELMDHDLKARRKRTRDARLLFGSMNLCYNCINRYIDPSNTTTLAIFLFPSLRSAVPT